MVSRRRQWETLEQEALTAAISARGRASRTRFRKARRRGRARVHRVVEPAEPLADDLADDRRADVEVRRRLGVAVRRRAGLWGRGGATSTLES